MSSIDERFNDSRSLLNELRSDFQGQGKLSCRDCLRSKANPCPAVVKVIQNHSALLTPPIIDQACETLVHGLQKEYFSSTANLSSLECMSRFATMFRFIQLLFACDEHNIPIDQEVNKMFNKLIQTMTQVLTLEVSKLPKSNNGSSDNDNDDEHEERQHEETCDLTTSDASKGFDIRQVVCFSFVSILRFANHVSKNRAQLSAQLWKSICGLQKVSEKFLPCEMLEDAITTLLGLMEDGIPMFIATITSTESTNNHERLALHQGKCLSFLAMRLASLVQPYHNFSVSLLLPKAYKCLFSLRSMDLVANHASFWEENQIRAHPFAAKVCQEIVSKVEKPLLRVILNRKQSSIHPVALDCLLKLKISPLSRTSKNDRNQSDARTRRLVHMAQLLGRVMFLRSILKQGVMDKGAAFCNENAHSLLAVCESLHSVALAQCHVPLTLACRLEERNETGRGLLQYLITDSLLVMSNALSKIESSASIESLPSFQLPQLHRLLIRWLAPTTNTGTTNMETPNQQHPIAREVTISLIYLYVVGDGEDNSRHSFLSLLVKILFDPRTTTSLRNNVSCVLVRIQSSAQNDIRDFVHALLETELQGRLKVDTDRGKKRKRKRSGASLVSFSSKQYGFHDIQAISAVLRSYQPTKRSKALNNMIQLLCQGIVNDGVSNGEEKRNIFPKRLLKRAEQNCLVLAILEGALSSNKENNGSTNFAQQAFEQVASVNVLGYQRAIIRSLLMIPMSAASVKSSNGQINDNSFTKRHALLCSSVLRFCSQVCDCCNDVTKIVPIEDLCRLILFCTNKLFLPVDQGKHFEDNRYRSNVLFDAIYLLGSIGKTLPPDCPGQILKDIKATFSKLLFLDDGLVVSCTLSAVARFGSELHQSLQQILVDCLPRHQLEVFKKRLRSNKGNIERSPNRENKSQLEVCLKLARSMERFYQKRDHGGNIFPSVATFEIPLGSYFMQMNTQEGRQALVIFPPGTQSIEDIKYMKGLERDDELDDEIQTLKQSTITGNGGCKCLLQSYK